MSATIPVETEVSAGLNVAEDKLVVSIACGDTMAVAKLVLPDALKFLGLVQAAVVRMEKASGTPDEAVHAFSARIATLETELHAARAQIAKLTCPSGD